MNQKIATKKDHHFDLTDTGRFRECSISSARELESELMKLWNAEVNFREKVMSLT